MKGMWLLIVVLMLVPVVYGQEYYANESILLTTIHDCWSDMYVRVESDHNTTGWILDGFVATNRSNVYMIQCVQPPVALPVYFHVPNMTNDVFDFRFEYYFDAFDPEMKRIVSVSNVVVKPLPEHFRWPVLQSSGFLLFGILFTIGALVIAVIVGFIAFFFKKETNESLKKPSQHISTEDIQDILDDLHEKK